VNVRHGSLVRACSGSQACYHCHRPGAELTHLLGIGLDPRGLPRSLFTVNRWVANDAWLPACPCAELVQRFSLAARDGSLEQALEDRDLEIPSQVAIECGADLDAVQQQWRVHGEQLRFSSRSRL
jgi:hypothetical protein